MHFSGFLKFHSGGKIDYAIGIPTTIIAMIGGYLGANTLLLIPETLLDKLVGVFLLLILPTFLLDKDMGIVEGKTISRGRKSIGYIVFFLIGFWGAFFGGGFAFFATYAYILLFGQTFLQCAGTKMVLGLGIAVISILIYGAYGAVNWTYGITLISGECLGAYLGATVALKKGSKWIKIIFIFMVIFSSIKLIV